MSATTISFAKRPHVAGTPPPSASRGASPPARLTSAQLRELESELHRELAALERRLIAEAQVASTETHQAAGDSDTIVRRDLVAAALARLDAGEYGTCTRCGEPIPYGRLLVMPEATHCLGCSGRT
jgi:RNA polymerase-binding transcription factor DksA